LTNTNDNLISELAVDPIPDPILGESSSSLQQLLPLQTSAQSTSADDFNSLFGDNIMDSLSGGSMSMEELFAGTSGFTLNDSEHDGELNLCCPMLTTSRSRPRVPASPFRLRSLVFRPPTTTHLLSTYTDKSGPDTPSSGIGSTAVLCQCSSRVPIPASPDI
jgi:hypothetical protein